MPNLPSLAAHTWAGKLINVLCALYQEYSLHSISNNNCTVKAARLAASDVHVCVYDLVKCYTMSMVI